MKWKSHQALTFSTVFAITGNPLNAAISAAGSVIPDAAEGGVIRHRTLTHWWVPYALIVIYFTLIREGPQTIIHTVPLYLSAGALLHIIQDAFSGKVPLFSPFRKSAGIFLIKVGSVCEYLAVTILSGVLLLSRVLV